MNRLIVYGHHVKGAGKASIRASVSDHTSVDLAGVNLIGTYNIVTKVQVLQGIPPSRIIRGVSYWLVMLNDEHYGWAMRWEGSDQPHTILEIYSRKLLPPTSDLIKVTVFIPMSDVKRFAEQSYDAGHKWFQTHAWLPKKYRRHDATRILEYMGDIRGKTILDQGACEGQLSTALARRGGIVTAVEMRSAALGKRITEEIEGMDVQWIASDKLPSGRWDIIISLSVWHQGNPSYSGLEGHLKDLELHGRKVYIELMNPPIVGEMDVIPFMQQHGYSVLETYRHPVRRVRSVFVK